MNVSTSNWLSRFLVFVLLAVSISMVSAQEDAQHPFLRLLSLIPDNAAAAEDFSYVDYRAVIEAREGAPSITSAEEWLELIAEDSPENGLWFAATLGIGSGPSDLARYAFGRPVEAREATGIDPYTVERGISYGVPPGMVTLLEGEFDEALIAEAYTANDYQEHEIAGLTLWCGNDECDGHQMNLSLRNPANPFGGALGRQQSLLVADTLVASSPDSERLEAQAEAIAGESESLSENPTYRAAAEAITQDGLLLQTWFIQPFNISGGSQAIISALGERATAEQVEALLEQFEEEFVPIPQYNLLAIADTATETEQIALITLVYNDAEDAQAAAEVIPARIADYESLVVQRPMQDMLEERGVTAVETSIYENEDRAVLLIEFSAPLPPSEPSPEDGRYPSSSLVFRLLVDMYIRRDISWLAALP